MRARWHALRRWVAERLNSPDAFKVTCHCGAVYTLPDTSKVAHAHRPKSYVVICSECKLHLNISQHPVHGYRTPLCSRR